MQYYKNISELQDINSELWDTNAELWDNIIIRKGQNIQDRSLKFKEKKLELWDKSQLPLLKNNFYCGWNKFPAETMALPFQLKGQKPHWNLAFK